MKRIINRIKNIFGADVRLRKWCIKQAIRGARYSPTCDYLADAARIEAHLRGSYDISMLPAQSTPLYSREELMRIR